MFHHFAFIGILAILLFILFRERLFKHYQLARWTRKLQLKQHRRAFDTIYQDVDGFTLSRRARQSQDAFEYTYGEINFLPFIALIALAKPQSSTRFYDLGSGVGKAVLAAAMVFPMEKACGIELFEPLHQAAVATQARLASMTDDISNTKTICFIHDNFLHVDWWRDATLIFINATGFFGTTWERLNQQLAENNIPSCVIITISKKLNAEHFTIIAEHFVEMSWGIAVAYIQILQTNPAADDGEA